jgi:hypothetical protein
MQPYKLRESTRIFSVLAWLSYRNVVMILRDVLVTKTGDAGVLKVPVAHWGDGIVKMTRCSIL